MYFLSFLLSPCFLAHFFHHLKTKDGATLLFTSSKTGKNTEVLAQYLTHRFLTCALTCPHQVVERDGFFVPSGWDSHSKINFDFEQQKFCKDASLPYDSVIKRPAISDVDPSLPQNSSSSAVSSDYVVCEEDAEFLQKLKTELTIPSSSPQPEPTLATPRPTSPLTSTSTTVVLKSRSQSLDELQIGDLVVEPIKPAQSSPQPQSVQQHQQQQPSTVPPTTTTPPASATASAFFFRKFLNKGATPTPAPTVKH